MIVNKTFVNEICKHPIKQLMFYIRVHTFFWLIQYIFLQTHNTETFSLEQSNTSIENKDIRF